MSFYFHITTTTEWSAAVASGAHAPSSLATEGFVHCSLAEQILGTANRFFGGRSGLVVLRIAPARLDAQHLLEPADGQLFPHVYGAIPTSAVIETQPLLADDDGVFRRLPSWDATTARSVEELVQLVEAGATPKYTFFWGHEGAIERACFSQWFERGFTIDGTHYPTAEHWMMAEKARISGDASARERVLAAKTPGEAKAIGREVTGYDDAVWSRARFETVVRGNDAKFGQNAELGAILRAAGRVLVEASPRDVIWGIGLGAKNEKALDPRTWRGKNLLGFALMEARSRLMARER